MSDVDAFDLPPLQYAVLEMLAARYRLGEEVWTVHTKVKPALTALADRGLVEYDHGIMPHTFRAELTEAGREATLSENYVSPLERRIRSGVS